LVLGSVLTLPDRAASATILPSALFDEECSLGSSWAFSQAGAVKQKIGERPINQGSEANKLYWENKVPSHEAKAEHQRRQDRLEEVRHELNELDHPG
jgi:hypothetical protein